MDFIEIYEENGLQTTAVFIFGGGKAKQKALATLTETEKGTGTPSDGELRVSVLGLFSTRRKKET